MNLPSPLGRDVKVLVLAGSDDGVEYSPSAVRAREVPLSHKAFLSLRGRLVIDYVLDVIAACGFERVWVLADERHLARVASAHRFIPIAQRPGATFFANLLAAHQVLDPLEDEPVLVMFGDHPLTSPAVVQRFLAECGPHLDRADFFHAFALQADYAAYAPWFRRTSAHTREMSGRASGLSLAVPSRLHALNRFQHLYGVRKQERYGAFLSLLVSLARSLGREAPRGVLDSLCIFAAKEMEKRRRRAGVTAAMAGRLERWFARRVPVERIERYAARVLGAERGVRLIPIPHGGIALDVDFAEELESLERFWEEISRISARQDAAIADGTA